MKPTPSTSALDTTGNTNQQHQYISSLLNRNATWSDSSLTERTCNVPNRFRRTRNFPFPISMNTTPLANSRNNNTVTTNIMSNVRYQPVQQRIVHNSSTITSSAPSSPARLVTRRVATEISPGPIRTKRATPERDELLLNRNVGINSIDNNNTTSILFVQPQEHNNIKTNFLRELYPPLTCVTTEGGISDTNKDCGNAADTGTGAATTTTTSGKPIQQQQQSFVREIWKSLDHVLFSTKLTWLLILGPIAVLGESSGLLKEHWLFLLAGLALIPCAERLSFITEEVAGHTNSTIGALLNATFGNAPELLISVAALRSGFYRVVQLVMLGSMLTNLILVFGVACIIGGCRYQVQHIRQSSGNVSVVLLLVATAGSLFPAALVLSGQFPNPEPPYNDESRYTSTETIGQQHHDLNAGNSSFRIRPSNNVPSEEEVTLCRVNAFIMLVLYFCYLVFQLGTHKEEFDEYEELQSHKKNAQRNIACQNVGQALLSFANAINPSYIVRRCLFRRRNITTTSSIVNDTTNNKNNSLPLHSNSKINPTSPDESTSSTDPGFDEEKALLKTSRQKKGLNDIVPDNYNHESRPTKITSDLGSSVKRIHVESHCEIGFETVENNSFDLEHNDRKDGVVRCLRTEKSHISPAPSSCQSAPAVITMIPSSSSSATIITPDYIDTPGSRQRRQQVQSHPKFEHINSKNLPYLEVPKMNTSSLKVVKSKSSDGQLHPDDDMAYFTDDDDDDSANDGYDDQCEKTDDMHILRLYASAAASGHHSTTFIHDDSCSQGSSHHQHRRAISTASKKSIIIIDELHPVVSKSEISLRVGIFWLFVMTLCISSLSDVLVETIDGFAGRMHLSEVFTSMVIIPFFSNIAEQVSAFIFAYRNEMDLCVGVTIGSAIQIATMVLPGSVLIGMALDRNMTLYFHTFETISLFFGVIVVAAILQGGTTNWLVGAMLVGIYVMFAAGIWYHEIEDLDVDIDSQYETKSGGG